MPPSGWPFGGIPLDKAAVGCPTRESRIDQDSPLDALECGGERICVVEDHAKATEGASADACDAVAKEGLQALRRSDSGMLAR